MVIKNCLNCKFAKDISFCYCFCKKKQGRKQVSMMTNKCNKWEYIENGDIK